MFYHFLLCTCAIYGVRSKMAGVFLWYFGYVMVIVTSEIDDTEECIAPPILVQCFQSRQRRLWRKPER